MQQEQFLLTQLTTFVLTRIRRKKVFGPIFVDTRRRRVVVVVVVVCDPNQCLYYW